MNHKWKEQLRDSTRGLGFIILVVIIAVVFDLIDSRFLTYMSLIGIARHMASNGLAALGLTFVVIVHRFDLSITGVAAFCAMTLGALIAVGLPLWLVVIIGLALGGGIGAISGIAISYFDLPDIVTTIAVGSMGAGLAFIYSGGSTIFQNFFTCGIIDINNSRVGSVPVAFWVLIGIYAVAWFVIGHTRTGIAFYGTGENPKAAHFSGIATRRFVALAYILGGMGTVLAVVLLLAESGTAEPNTGANLLMPAYASVFLGAAIMGRTSVIGTFGGVLLITMLLDGFAIMGLPYYYSDAVVSLILLIAVFAFSDSVRGALKKIRNSGIKLKFGAPAGKIIFRKSDQA